MTNTKKLNVALTIDFDGISLPLSMNLTHPNAISRHLFGVNLGIDRLIAVLQKHDVAGTCFIPGHTLEHATDKCKMVRDAGLEIAHHGLVHEPTKGRTPTEERRFIEAPLELMQQHLGIKPVGYRAPFLMQTNDTYKLLLEYGFKYDSSERAKDSPYFIDIDGDKLLEIPSKMQLVDTIYFMEFASGNFMPTATPPEEPEKIWQAEFKGMYESNDDNLCFVHTVHPFCSGHFYALQMYDRFIGFMKNHAGVNFLTMQNLGRNFMDKHKA